MKNTKFWLIGMLVLLADMFAMGQTPSALSQENKIEILADACKICKLMGESKPLNADQNEKRGLCRLEYFCKPQHPLHPCGLVAKLKAGSSLTNEENSAANTMLEGYRTTQLNALSQAANACANFENLSPEQRKKFNTAGGKVKLCEATGTSNPLSAGRLMAKLQQYSAQLTLEEMKRIIKIDSAY